VKKLIFLSTLITVTIMAAACGSGETTPGGGNSNSPQENSAASTPMDSATVIGSPTEAIRIFIEGVRAKDEKAMRSALSKASVAAFDKRAEEGKVSFFDAVVGEDLEEMSKMPEMRNEKIDGEKATLEVKDPNNDKWDPVPFVKEDGSWKIALFDRPEEGKE